MVALDASKCVRIGEGETFEQVLGLLLVLFEVWASRQISIRHTKLLSRFAWSPRASGWKEDSSKCETERWARPFPRTGCALRAEDQNKKLSSGSQLSAGQLPGRLSLTIQFVGARLIA